MKAKAGWIVAIAVLVASLSGSAAFAGKLITGRQIKDRSIAIRDLAKSARPKPGRVGPAGPAGPSGAAGPAGGLNSVKTGETAPAAYGPFGSDTAVVGVQAICPAGTTLVGGGYRHEVEGATSIFHTIVHNAPAGPNAWGVILVNLDETGDELVVVAQCATGSGATIAAQRSSTANGDFDRALADAKRRHAARTG